MASLPTPSFSLRPSSRGGRFGYAGRGPRRVRLTVGDFGSEALPGFPERLCDLTKAALDGRHELSANGIPALRDRSSASTRHLASAIRLDSILIRRRLSALIYSLFRVVVEPGDTVSFPVPAGTIPSTRKSWASWRRRVCAPEDAFQLARRARRR